MLIRISIALIAILICYNLPVYFDGEYTELGNLRENSYRAVAIVIVMMMLCRGLYAYAISLVEIFLIAVNCYIAYHWGLRDEIFFATHYTILQGTAYGIELAIIGIAGILGAATIGTDDDSFSNKHMPRWFSRPYRGMRN